MLLFKRYYKSYFKEFYSFEEASNYYTTQEENGELYSIAIIDNADGNILWHKEDLLIEEINKIKLEATRYD